MNKPLSTGELAELQKEFPVEEVKPRLTKKEKLLRLADLVEKYKHKIELFDRIEQRGDPNLKQYFVPGSIFSVAAQDEFFREDGLKVAEHTFGRVSAYDGKVYFELTADELHALSCNCGGQLSSGEIASRLRTMAGGGRVAQFIRGMFSF